MKKEFVALRVMGKCRENKQKNRYEVLWDNETAWGKVQRVKS